MPISFLVTPIRNHVTTCTRSAGVQHTRVVLIAVADYHLYRCRALRQRHRHHLVQLRALQTNTRLLTLPSAPAMYNSITECGHY